MAAADTAAEHLPPADPQFFSGRSALITGGAGGLGEAFARALLEVGADVMLADVNRAAGEELSLQLGCSFVELDVTDLEANRTAVKTAVEQFGKLDLLLLNAGIESPFSLGDDFDPEAWRRAMAINLDGVAWGFHAARPALIEAGGGSVLVTASLAAFAAMAPQPTYGANKAAVIGLVRALGAAHAHEGIRVNAICPGFTETPIIDGVRELLQAADVPIIEPQTVAAAALDMLAAEQSGQALVVQAGVEPYLYRFPNLPRARKG